jgi:hypothetical protein
VFQGLLLFTLLACDTLIAYRVRRSQAALRPPSAGTGVASLQASTPIVAQPVARTTEGSL